MDNAAIEDIFSGLGAIIIKNMFGGKGIYHQGLIIALEVDGEILLKADAHSAPDFALAGALQWAYENKKTGKPAKMPYWSIPHKALDDPDTMTLWARKAFEASLRSKAKNKPRI